MRFTPALSLLVFATLALFAPDRAGAFDRAYWSTGTTRSTPLSTIEQQELDAQRVSTLYWQVGELSYRGGACRWQDDPIQLQQPHQRVVPVVRLGKKAAEMPDLFQDPEALIAKLRPLFGRSVNEAPGAVVIDFSCPDALLPAYIAFLARVHQDIPKLEATALASWADQPSFGDLQKSVSALHVQFFDPRPNRPALNPGTVPSPPLDSAWLKKPLAAWNRCRVPWRAVLPNFATINVYDIAGTWRTVLRDWSWGDTMFSMPLNLVAPMANGQALFRVQRATQIAEESVRLGELVSVSLPERSVLAQALGEAESAGAAGGTFLLPTGKDESGWSLRQLGNLATTDVRLSVHADGTRLVLTNESGADLPARCLNATDRGYSIDLIAGPAGWSEALQGDFFDVSGFRDANEKQERANLRKQALGGDVWHLVKLERTVAVPIFNATRLRLRFGALRAGASLRSGPIRLNATGDWAHIQYRVMPVHEEWKPLD